MNLSYFTCTSATATTTMVTANNKLSGLYPCYQSSSSWRAYNQEYQQIMQLVIVQYMQIGIIQSHFKKAVATGPGGANDYSTWNYTYTMFNLGSPTIIYV
jgi:hypothetical protein